MPNLWKNKGSSRISKLFSDLQTPHKRGGSLVVETGFPTSIIDLFVKNRDRLKKKKQSRKPILEENEEENEVEVCLASEIELEVEKNENACVGLDSKGNKVEGNDGNERLDWGILGNKVICVSGLMGLCVLCSQGFVVGLSISAILLVLFEFVVNLVVLHWVRSCLDVLRMPGVLKFRWVFDGVVTGGGSGVGFGGGVDERDGCGLDMSDCHSKCEIEEVIESNHVCGIIENWDFDGASELGNVSSKRVIVRGGRAGEKEGECSGMVENSNFEGVGECGNVSSKRWILGEQGGEKESECSNVSSKRGFVGERGGGEEGEWCKMVDENGKRKKEKKFWKRCVFRHISKKMKDDTKQGKQTHLRSGGHELPTTCIVSNASAFDEEVKRDKQVVEPRMEKFGNGGNHSSSHIGERLHRQNIATKSYRVVVYQGLNFECIVVIVIALVGLIDGRMLALVLTLICCVGFMLMRRS